VSSSPSRGASGSLWDDDELAKKLTVSRPPTASRDSSGSLWDDDELAKQLTPPRPTAAVPEEKRRGIGKILGVTAGAVVLIAALVVLVVFVTIGKPAPSPKPGPTAAPTGSNDAGCPAHTDGNVTIGNGPGDTSSGTGAILGFEHAYYADRSGAKARTFVTADANVQVAADLQNTIDQHVPRGMSYCLRIATMAPDRFNVEITERHPDGPPNSYREVITTVSVQGRTLIDLISSQ
jgi:hypothetical protein